jgi:putative NADH-flavin reductase
MKVTLFGDSGMLGSFIAREDLEIAFLDELERPHSLRQRIALAY